MRPRARIISLIGEELISDESVAVVELVKNAYDADAANVTVSFVGEDPEHPTRITVQDDGCGMGLKTVLRSWLEPATNAKRKVDHSPKGRLYQGAKGIGRFAAARLAERLTLETKRLNDSRGVVVEIAWGDFSENSYLDDIGITYTARPMENLHSGTRLTMTGVRIKWTESIYTELHTRLSRLISPFQEVRDFTISLQIPWYPNLDGEVQPPELISKPRYRLTGHLDIEGRFTGQMFVDATLHKTYADHKVGGAGIRRCRRDRPGPPGIQVHRHGQARRPLQDAYL